MSLDVSMLQQGMERLRVFRRAAGVKGSLAARRQQQQQQLAQAQAQATGSAASAFFPAACATAPPHGVCWGVAPPVHGAGEARWCRLTTDRRTGSFRTLALCFAAPRRPFGSTAPRARRSRRGRHAPSPAASAPPAPCPRRAAAAAAPAGSAHQHGAALRRPHAPHGPAGRGDRRRWHHAVLHPGRAAGSRRGATAVHAAAVWRPCRCGRDQVVLCS